MSPQEGTISRESFHGGWSIALAVWMIVAGLLAIILPGVAGVAVNLVVAWLVIVGGVAHLGLAWNRRSGRDVVGQILLGIVYLVVGFYLLTHPLRGLAALTLLLAIYLLVESVLEFIIAFRLRPLPGWGWLLVDGVVTLVLAALIWRSWPASSEWALGTLIGISMIFSGFTRVLFSISHRGRRQLPQVPSPV